MIWNLMLFVVHLAACIGFVYLYRSAPCWMQRLVVVGLSIAMGFIALGYMIDFVGDIFPALGWYGGLYVKITGYLFEHVAILLYVFRLTYQQHQPIQGEPRKWVKSSAHSPA